MLTRALLPMPPIPGWTMTLPSLERTSNQPVTRTAEAEKPGFSAPCQRGRARLSQGSATPSGRRGHATDILVIIPLCRSIQLRPRLTHYFIERAALSCRQTSASLAGPQATSLAKSANSHCWACLEVGYETQNAAQTRWPVQDFGWTLIKASRPRHWTTNIPPRRPPAVTQATSSSATTVDEPEPWPTSRSRSSRRSPSG